MDKMDFAKPLGAMLKERRMLKDARHVAFLSHMALSMKVRAFPTAQYLEAGTIRADLSTLYALAPMLALRAMDLITALPEELNDVQRSGPAMIP